MNKKVATPGLENRRLTAVGTRCADHVTPLYPQKLALTSPTGGGRSVGIVLSRTKATEFSFIYIYIYDISRLRVKDAAGYQKTSVADWSNECSEKREKGAAG